MPVAVVRGIPESFSESITSQEVVIDVGAAREQHAEYRARLEESGFRIVAVPADEAYPDCPFVEDAAVTLGGSDLSALVSRPGHPNRRGEVGPVAEALAAWCPVTVMEEPATLDGGDVLRVGGVVFVGRSARTNAAGVTRLSEWVGRLGFTVVPVEVTGVLHLKSAVTALDDVTVLLAPGMVAGDPFAGLHTVEIVGPDPHAANVVRLADGSILVSDAGVGDQIAELGYRAVPCDVSEFAKADGGLTCLSIRLRNR